MFPLRAHPTVAGGVHAGNYAGVRWSDFETPYCIDKWHHANESLRDTFELNKAEIKIG